MPSGRNFFDLDNIDGERLRKIASKLRKLGYTERGVRKRLRLSRLSDLKLESYPYYLHDRLARRDPLDLAILLFLLQGVVAVEELDAVLDREDRRLLKSMGVLLGQKSTRTYRSAVSLYPQRDFLLFTDHRFQHQPWITARRPGDPVMFLGPEAHYLMRASIRKPVGSALDLCCGAGFHGIFCASYIERVVGVDSNRRAINFARVNAIANNTWNISFLEGDLFDPVKGGRFDYIMASPPCAPSPGYELRYRDGGPSGADVLRRIISGIPDYLSAGGFAQIVAHVGEREGEPYLERLRRWLAGANMNIHALKYADLNINDYALERIAEPFTSGDYATYAANQKRWIDNLRNQRFKRLIGVILTLEWNDDRASPPWTQEDEVKPPRRSIGEDILQLFKARRKTRRPEAARDLDRHYVGVPDDLILSERRTPSGGGFVTKDFRVTWRDPSLSPELEIKPLVRDLLELVDNRRGVPAIIREYARARGIPEASVDQKARQAFLAMYERGLITLDRMAGEPPPPPPPSTAAREDGSGDDLLDPDALPELDHMIPDNPAELPPAPPAHYDPLTASPLQASGAHFPGPPMPMSGSGALPPPDMPPPPSDFHRAPPSGALAALAAAGEDDDSGVRPATKDDGDPQKRHPDSSFGPI